MKSFLALTRPRWEQEGLKWENVCMYDEDNMFHFTGCLWCVDSFYVLKSTNQKFSGQKYKIWKSQHLLIFIPLRDKNMRPDHSSCRTETKYGQMSFFHTLLKLLTHRYMNVKFYEKLERRWCLEPVEFNGGRVGNLPQPLSYYCARTPPQTLATNHPY